MRPDGAPVEHLDEGLTHAWLDGALPPDESARIEAHIAECRDCAVIVAEARGLIAGASRIVGALDAVPGGVVPVPAAGRGIASPRLRTSRRWAARAAAAVVVMAAGTTLVVRSSERDVSAAARSDAVAAPAPEPTAGRRDTTRPRLDERRAAAAVADAAPAAPAHAEAPPAPLATGAFDRSRTASASARAAIADAGDATTGVVRGAVVDARGTPLGGASVAVGGDAPATSVADCYAVHADGPAPALPARLRLASPPRPDARWTRVGTELRVTLGGADSTTLVLHADADGWSGVARAAATARAAAVHLARVTDCGVP